MPQFKYFNPIFWFSSFFYCSFLIAVCGAIFFSAIIAKMGHNSASSASFFLPLQGLTVIVLLLQPRELVSNNIVVSMFLPSRLKSLPLKLLVCVKWQVLCRDGSCRACA